MQVCGREWFGAVCQTPSSSSIRLNFSNFMHRQLAGTTRFQPTRAVAAVLITEHACLAGVVAPQPMRAHRARESIVESRKWLSAGNGCPDQSVHILDRLNLCPDNTAHPHSRYLTAAYLLIVQQFITQ